MTVTQDNKIDKIQQSINMKNQAKQMGSTKKSLVHCVRISHRPEKLITFNGRKSCD